MNKAILNFMSALDSFDPSKEADVVNSLYDLVETIEDISDSETVIPDIFKFMGKFPVADIGSPGPLVHFVENSYPYYLKELMSSSTKTPSIHTLWMINRILNSDLKASTRDELISILILIKNDKKQLKTLRDEAKNYYALHSSNNS